LPPRPGGRAYATAEEALKAGELYGVVVASPTAYHPANTIAALEAKLPVLLEKAGGQNRRGSQEHARR
jgi:predicted dehydrogenase